MRKINDIEMIAHFRDKQKFTTHLIFAGQKFATNKLWHTLKYAIS